VTFLAADSAEKRMKFFRYLFGQNVGIVGFARLHRASSDFVEEYFEYPRQLEEMAGWADQWTMTHDVYYCPQLLSGRERKKETVDLCTAAWSDLDECQPIKLKTEPTITIESSPGRYQALWVFKTPTDPAEAEDISRRIAYYHLEDGADKTGWDLTQLLRVPFTFNHKYRPDDGLPPVVTVIGTTGYADLDELQTQYPQVSGFEFSDIPFPDVLPERSAEELLQEHKYRLMPTTMYLFQDEPEGDWSKNLWQLEMSLYEGGVPREEVFVICEAAACNKYKRDGRSPMLLWKEVCRAFQKYEERTQLISRAQLDMRPLLSDQERRDSEAVITPVEEYIEWAKTVGDAAWQYHQAGAFIALSSLMAGRVRLPTSFGTMMPNLWFMILADTTLTRKTTAMDMAIDLVTEIDSDAILATDGSIEGLFTSLSMRPGRPSVFLRDEFSGLLEAMVKKEYYAGMAETLTKLYDGKFQKRVLRKETVEVRDPVLILFAGGIRTRILSLLNYEHVASGFLPRFVFITADSDVTRLRPLGPPTDESSGARDYIRGTLANIYSHYNRQAIMHVEGRDIASPVTTSAELTADAWLRYNKFESDMLEVGLKSPAADILTPSFDRLAKSGLKAAVLIAASRRLDERVVVTEEDLVKAFSYVEAWREHTMLVLNNIGKSTQEKTFDLVLQAVVRKPGLMRAQLMQNHHLNAREASQILDTLEQRGQITRQRSGRSEKIFPVT
jgi:hypothetical protein